MPPDLAVLTGDLIASSRTNGARLNAAFDALRRAADAVADLQRGDTRLTRSRGDGWQLCLTRPDLALRAALLVRAALGAEGRDLRTRIAIATGPGDSGDTGETRDLNAATGPVFVASGRALDALRGDATMVHADGGAIGAATRLADHISSAWTQVQAQTVFLLLKSGPMTGADAAQILGKSRQAVNKSAAAAGLRAIDDALGLVEDPAR